MYIAPTSNLYICSGIPLDATYKNVVCAGNNGDNIRNKAKFVLSNYSYIRQTKTIRIEKRLEDVISCNYLVFQNSAFGDKWFYAFIDSCDYVNNETTEIKFSIDVMQTFWNDVVIKPCFVVREHSVTDEPGDNIMEESVQTGEIVYSGYGRFTELVKLMCIVAYADTENASFNYIDKCASGLALQGFDLSDNLDLIALREILQMLTTSGHADTVQAIYFAPFNLIDRDDSDHYKIKSGGSVTREFSKPIAIDGYEPRNKKLLTYPYTWLHVDNGQGENLALRYEFFDSDTPEVEIFCSCLQPVKSILRVKNYKGANDVHYNAESCVISQYPVASWVSDYYKAWLAQSSVPFAFNMLNAVGSGNLSGGVNQLFNFAAQNIVSATKRSDTVHGGVSGATTECSYDNLTFNYGIAHITREYAEAIDDYFDRFGYATNRVKIPNFSVRPVYNYVLTKDALVVPKNNGCPGYAVEKIKSILDGGCTFWNSLSSVGNYNADNTV